MPTTLIAEIAAIIQKYYPLVVAGFLSRSLQDHPACGQRAASGRDEAVGKRQRRHPGQQIAHEAVLSIR